VRLAVQQLNQALQKGLGAIYFLHGDDPLQLGEAADAIRASARQVGFNEREVLIVDAHFHWQSIFDSAVSNSIFSDKKILDLRIPEGKLGTDGAKFFQDYCKNIPSDTLLLVSASKLTKEAYKTRWFETVEKCAITVQFKPLEGQELVDWLMKRAQQRGLQIDKAGIKLLASRIEGNLLAAVQEIEKLYVLYGSTAIDSQAIEDVVSDSSRYDVFKLIDACLADNIKRLMKILQGLRDEGVLALLVLWALTREARLLLTMPKQTKGYISSNPSAWEKHINFQREALGRLKRSSLEDIMLLSAKADLQIKGLQKGDPWETLLKICLLFTSHPVLKTEIRL
jgi:DNA polymerase III subunit delta